jgi:peptidyl-prolyl cis-trans isomerase A (cyclophilin A)
MIRPLALLALGSLTLAGCGDAVPANAPAPANASATGPAPAQTDTPRVRLETGMGAIIVELDGRRAPLTTANFLAYVDQHRFDGTTFYRAARTPGAQGRGFVQGGIRRNYRLMLAPVAHEPTSATGLRHRDGTISMARTDPGSAMGNFFITVGAMPQMDAHGADQGFAAFGHVVEGMDVVRHILAAPTVANAGSGAMRGQMIEAPVRISSARRLP